MKTLDQWLEDSSSSSSSDEGGGGGGQQAGSISDVRSSASAGERYSGSRNVSVARQSGGVASGSGSVASAHTPPTSRPTGHPTSGLYGRQDETREKMLRLLGTDAVARATSASSSPTSGSPVWPLAAAPDRSHFPFGATPTSMQPVAQSAWVPAVLGGGGGSLAGTSATSQSGAQTRPLTELTRTDTATESSHLPEIEKTMQGLSPGVSGPVYEAVEVMVVDRGTQTVTTVGTQTDPLPMPYGAYYPGPYAPSPYTGGGYSRWAMPPAVPVPPGFGLGVDGRPYRQHMHDYEGKEAAAAAKLRGELEMIQNSIDMLIARYNLPPPPM